MATIYDRLLLAKVETTKGTDAVPTAALNAIRCVSFATSVTQNNIERSVVKQTMGNLAHLVDPDASVTVEVVVELKGSGTAGTAPDIAPLMQACRMLETIAAGTSVSYNPSTAVEKTITLYVYKDGMLWKITGAVGTYSVSSDIGSVPTATFSFQGGYITPVVAAVPVGASFEPTDPVVASTSDVITDGLSIKAGAFSADIGNDVQEHKTTGEHSFVVTNRAPTMTFTKDSIATAAEWAALANGTDASLSATFGAVAGNITTITAPSGRRQSVAYSERAERDTLDVTYSLFESTSDDQLSVSFT